MCNAISGIDLPTMNLSIIRASGFGWDETTRVVPAHELPGEVMVVVWNYIKCKTAKQHQL